MIIYTQLAIFGNPVSHSKSPLMHNQAIAELGLSGCYGRYLLEDGNKTKETFLSLKLHGANITVPHKESAYAQADFVEGLAQEIGAVNTYVLQNEKVIAYNTDAPGFLRSVKSFLPAQNALVLGAGGTAKAIAIALRHSGTEVTILNRSAPRLETFRTQGFSCSTWDSFQTAPYDLVANTTSAGLQDNSLPAPKELLEPTLKSSKHAFDVIYGKTTPFLYLCAEHNIPHKDGADMLLYQGVLAFELFFDHPAPFEVIATYMSQGLHL